MMWWAGGKGEEKYEGEGVGEMVGMGYRQSECF